MSRPSALEVRVVSGDDWAAWRDIRLRALEDSPSAFGSTYAREAAFAEDDWRERSGGPDSVAVLVLEDGRPVGMGGGFREPPGLRVVAMWVEPQARGRGVGHLVLDAVSDWAAQRGLRVYLDVAATNLAARRSYERYGFVATGRTRRLREGSGELVERMVLGRPDDQPGNSAG